MDRAMLQCNQLSNVKVGGILLQWVTMAKVLELPNSPNQPFAKIALANMKIRMTRFRAWV